MFGWKKKMVEEEEAWGGVEEEEMWNPKNKRLENGNNGGKKRENLGKATWLNMGRHFVSTFIYCIDYKYGSLSCHVAWAQSFLFSISFIS